MKNIILARVLDVAAISMLLVEHSSANRFGAIVSVFLAMVMLLSFLGMTADLANKIKAKSWIGWVVGISVQVSYVGALILAGYPSVAAFYAIAAILLRASVYHKLKPQEAH